MMMGSSPRSLSAGRRLYELLEEQQEPFLLDIFLVENGYPEKSLNSEGAVMCWPGSAWKRLQRLASHRFRRQREGILRSLLAVLVHGKNGKTSNFDGKSLYSEGFSVSGCISDKSDHTVFSGDTDMRQLCYIKGNAERRLELECMEDTKQSSPVSVLELHSEDSDSIDYEHFKEKNTSITSLSLQEKASSDMFLHLLGYASISSRSPERSSGSLIGCQFSTWRLQAEDVTKDNQLLQLDFSDSRKQWIQLQGEMEEIGIEIGDAILEEMIENAVTDILINKSVMYIEEM